MDQNYLTTGEFAKLCHTSKHTLFHYCDIGLFRPAFTDENGYRYYHVLQYDLFLTIRQLHDIGMPLSEIKAYLAQRTPENMIELYQNQEILLEKQIKKLQQIQRNLHMQRKSAQQALSHSVGQYFFATQNTRRLLCTEIIRDIRDCVMTKKIGELVHSAEPVGQITVLGMICSSQDAMQAEQCPFRFYVDSSDVATKQSMTMPGGKYLCTYHHGGYETLSETYRNLHAYATGHGLLLSQEIYAEIIIGDWAVKSQEDYVIRVFSMLEETENRKPSLSSEI